MTTVLEIIGIGSIVGLGLVALGKLIPNDKLYAWGHSLGSFIDVLGSGKLGVGPWEKIEDFIIDSASAFFGGIKDGLDPEVSPDKVEEKKEQFKNVRK